MTKKNDNHCTTDCDYIDEDEVTLEREMEEIYLEMRGGRRKGTDQDETDPLI